MEEITGRGHREKIPSAKLKDQVVGKPERSGDEKRVILPTYIASNDPKFLLPQAEIKKDFHHSKIGRKHETTDFYTLGSQ